MSVACPYAEACCAESSGLGRYNLWPMTPNASSTTAIVMNPAATDDWWSEYPLNSASYEPSRYNGVEIRDLLASADTKCFSKETDHLPISLRVIDLNGSEAEGS